MRKTCCLAAVALCFGSVLAFSQTYTIRTVAGGGLPVNVPGSSASLIGPESVAVDSAGNIFFPNGNTVMRLDVNTGILTLVAGNGTSGYNGDGGPATSASLSLTHANTEANIPHAGDLAVDASGNLYIADWGNNRIRKVSNGVITTVAGGGSPSSGIGDGGLAISASLGGPLGGPSGVAVDNSGNLYIADLGNRRIRKVTANTGLITTVAGGGSPSSGNGDGGLATSASIYPFSVAADNSGNVYISEWGANRIRMVTASTGVITTLAGNGTQGYGGDGGPAVSSTLNFPNAVALDRSGNLYFADGCACIRKVTASTGVITTVAGNGKQGFSGDGGPATSANMSPLGVAIDSTGNLLIADYTNGRIRKVTASTGVITTLAGTGDGGYSGDGGLATSAGLVQPVGVTLDSSANLFIAEMGSVCCIAKSRIREVSGSTSVITTVAGNGTTGYSGDGGPATSADIYPLGVAVDSSGNLYIASDNRIRKVSNGVITTVAGNGTFGYSGDGGLATSASLYGPLGVAVDSSGDIYIADHYNHRIRRVEASTGVITTVAGNGTQGYSGDGGPATSASLNDPVAVFVDTGGNLYIADYTNGRIRKVTAGNGVITTVAGDGSFRYSGDGGPATTASLNGPLGVAVDGTGNLYIADWDNNRIRKVSNGVITTVAGGGSPSSGTGDGGLATSTSLNGPSSVAVDSQGRVYVADTGNNRVRVLIPSTTGCAYTVSPMSLQPAASGGSFPINIQTNVGCAWSVTGLAPWITVSGATSGTGPVTVTLVVAANSGAAQSATISVAGVPVTVNQAGSVTGGCTYTIGAGGQSFTAAGGNGSFTITTTSGCSWAAVSSATWITSTSAGTGSGTVTYQAAANAGNPARSGTISIGGLTFTVEQAGAPFSGFITAGSMAHIAAAGGWTTIFTFVNPSANPTQIRVNFFDDNGNPLTLTLNFPQMGESGLLASTIDRTLNPGAVLAIVAGGPALQPVLTGWAQLIANGSVNGFAAFRLIVGNIDSQALVPLETRNASAYVLAFDNTGGFVSGIALANISAQSGNVGITIRDDTGATVFSSTIAVAGMAHTSFVLSNSYGFTAGKRGTVEFDPPPGMQISTLGVQANTATGGFSTIPALTK
ncbi:MAG: hypothetical protein LAP61_22720 [Acidobacteriia bacterium]|nr:hypothetical protein [Terriglobia bacterium]